jgi:hypothetical protein
VAACGAIVYPNARVASFRKSLDACNLHFFSGMLEAHSTMSPQAGSFSAPNTGDHAPNPMDAN